MTRDELRAAMPIVSGIVDEFRSLMANGGRVIYASENGRVIDRREPLCDEQVFTVPAHYRAAFTPKAREVR